MSAKTLPWVRIAGTRGMGRRARGYLRVLSLVLCAVVVVAVLPSTAAWAREDAVDPAPLASADPVNEVPESVHKVPEDDVDIPDAPPVERPPAGSPQAQMLAAIEAEAAAERLTVEDSFTNDHIPAEAIASELGGAGSRCVGPDLGAYGRFRGESTCAGRPNQLQVARFGTRDRSGNHTRQ